MKALIKALKITARRKPLETALTAFYISASTYFAISLILCIIKLSFQEAVSISVYLALVCPATIYLCFNYLVEIVDVYFTIRLSEKTSYFS